MWLVRGLILGCIGFFTLACSGTGGAFNTSFCQEYDVSYIDSCNTTCSALGTDRQVCASQCQQSLLDDPMYQSMCSSATGEPQDVWPAEYVQNFMNACVAEGARVEDCSCMLDYLQKRMTPTELLAAENGMELTGEQPVILTEAARACIP